MTIRSLLSLGLLACAANAAQADLLWGVNGHPFTAYPGISIEQQLDHVKDLGTQSYRVNITDTGRAPELARLIRAAKARGITVLPVITPGNADLKNDSTEDLYRKAFNLAAALVSAFKDDVRIWELGNEMENFAIIQPCEHFDNGEQYNCNWGPAGGVTAKEYYTPRWRKVSAVLKGLSDGTVSADPTVRKAIGTAGWGHTGAFERLQQDGIRWDISVWHYYGDDPEWAFKALAAYKKPIWVTEFNNPYGSQNGEKEQAEGIKNLMARLRELGEKYNVEAAHIYELFDEPYWAPDFEAVMGLVRVVPNGKGGWRVGDAKPAYFAVKEQIRGGTLPIVVQRQCEPSAFDRLDATQTMQIAYAYCLALGRRPDPDGQKAWAATLRDGLTPTQMVAGMLLSDEFRSRHATFGLNSTDYVTLMYRLLLGRDPDQTGLTSYASALDMGALTRAAIGDDIIRSDEFRARHPILFPPSEALKTAAAPAPPSGRTVPRRRCDLKAPTTADPKPTDRVAYAFCLILGRAADGSGLNSWSTTLANGASIEEMLNSMLESEEFRSLYNTQSLKEAEFVTLMYRLLLNRNPDGDGFATYVTQINQGTLSRGDLQGGILASSEFREQHPVLFRGPRAAARPSN